MVTSSYPISSFITKHVSPTLPTTPLQFPLGRQCGVLHRSVPLTTPHNTLSLCFKHSQWLLPKCFPYILFSPAPPPPKHRETLQMGASLCSSSCSDGGRYPRQGTAASTLSLFHMYQGKEKVGNIFRPQELPCSLSPQLWGN